MKYIVVNVGCMCCTPSQVVAVVSEQARAEELCDHVNYGLRDPQSDCIYFSVPDEDYVDPLFGDVIEQGKKKMAGAG